MRQRITPWLAVMALAVLATARCDDGDHVAPEGATIDLAATPTTIVTDESAGVCFGLLGVNKCGTSDIVATVSSVVGVPLSDQDVRFTNTAGLLFTGTKDNPEPAANLPIRTDEFGNAHVQLITNSTTTVNARSGKATGTLTLNTTAAAIGRIDLNTDPGCAQEITSCSDVVCLIATALDVDDQPIPNLTIQFKLQNPGGEKAFAGTFNPAQPKTDASGDAITELTANSTCSADCGGGKCTTIDVVAFTQGGFQSLAVTISINIP